ncbi:DUF397 domain-containing protein [Streptomyces sp. NBC_00656]|uniref:DUF397 domain-containing protein n=1 Tax=Streptomyces sp. NBC_00656 TaxID=2903668 RepID=UPI00324D00EB
MVRARRGFGKDPCRSGKLAPGDLLGASLPRPGACVEVSAHPAAVHIRDAEVTDGPVLTDLRHAWSAFLGAATQGVLRK